MRRTHMPAGPLAAVLAVLIGLAVVGSRSAGAQSAAPRLYQSDLQYQGAFRLPPWAGSDAASFSYGGSGLGYNPANNSLFVVGHDQYQLSAEVSIPAIVNSTNLNNLQTAKLLQPFKDATEGTLSQINPTDPNAKKIGGQMVYNGQLYLTGYSYYDGAGTQSKSHFVRPTSLATAGQVKGPYQVGSWAGIVSDYLAPIPSEWQASFGGPVLTGGCCMSIIGRTSYGPAVSVFDPATLGVANPAPAVPVLYYNSTHTTLGAWDSTWNGTTDLFNGTTTQASGRMGLAFPGGTRSVLFFATQGIGPWCYGTGGASGGNCYDPSDPYKGVHAYPYVAEVWAYDANDLVAVKNGVKQPWEPIPYAVWTLTLPFGSPVVGGAAWDPATRRLFISQEFGDGSNPVIHVFGVAGGAQSPTAPPAAPTNLSVK